MSWSNRIFRHTKRFKNKDYVWYAVHEAFYDDSGKVTSWTELPIDPCGETPQELIDHLKQMLSDAEKSKDDILDL